MFVNGAMQGHGVFRVQNGKEYKGQIANGKRHGYGILDNNELKETYYGEFKEDK
jgi:hypothetical protein